MHAQEALDDLDRFGSPASVPEEDWPDLERKLKASADFSKGRALLQQALPLPAGEKRASLLKDSEASLLAAQRLNSADLEITYLLGLAQFAAGNTSTGDLAHTQSGFSEHVAIGVWAGPSPLPAKDPGRDKVLDRLDREFYQLNEIESQLFYFIEAHQNNVQLRKGSKPPIDLKRTKRSNAARLSTYLRFAKLQGVTLEELRQPARELARQKSIDATDAEIDAALTLYLFDRSLRADDLAACELVAPRAFQLMREDTTHCVLHREWVLRLIREVRLELADTSTLAYLEYLKECDQSTLSNQNRVLFWAVVLQEHRAALPKAATFFVANFPEMNLEEPLPTLHFIKPPRRPGKPV